MKKFLIGVAVGWLLSNNLAPEARYSMYVKLDRRYGERISKVIDKIA